LILLLAGSAIYFGLTPRFTAFAATSHSNKAEVPHTAPLTTGGIEVTMRLAGTIGAEKFQMIQAPQLMGLRSAGTVGNISTTTTPASAPTFTPADSSSLGGASNRFGDKQGNKPPPSTPYTPPSTAGSVYYSLATNQSLRGSGSNDFNLTILSLAAPGTRVKKGDIIAEFDRQTQLLRLDDYKDTVIQLSDNIERMRSDLQTSRKAHDHVIFAAKAALDKAELDLKTAPVRSANEVESLKLNLEEAKARYDQMLKQAALLDQSQKAQLQGAQIDREQGKMELERAQRNVDLMVIRAPMDGIVVLQTINRGGDMGPAQQGDQLYPGRLFMQVIDPKSMLLNGTISQVDAQQIKIGMKAKVHLDAYPNLEFPAHIAGINALSKISSRRPSFKGDIDVRVKLESIDGNVIPDISGSADVILGSEDKVVVAPRNAVFYKSGGAPYVYVQTPSGWERRDVSLGLANYTHVGIRSGVSSGEILALAEPELSPQAGKQ
jgi:multidrug efflux pump subunit AcrA (membrane-fusion protein)